MAAGDSNEQSALSRGLAVDVIEEDGWCGGRSGFGNGGCGRLLRCLSIFYNSGGGGTFKVGEELGEGGDSDEMDSGDEASEGEVFLGKIDSLEAGFLGGFDDVDDAADGFGVAIKGELANE